MVAEPTWWGLAVLLVGASARLAMQLIRERSRRKTISEYLKLARPGTRFVYGDPRAPLTFERAADGHVDDEQALMGD